MDTHGFWPEPIADTAAHVSNDEVDWKDASSIAVFLNNHLAEIEEKRREEERKFCGVNENGWGVLPDLVLERIFSFLNIQQRYYASCTCRQWYRAFHFQKTWNGLTLLDTTLTRRKYDYGERNYRHVLDHYRVQQLISHVGHHFQRLSLLPRSFEGLFAHSYFMKHVSNYAEKYEMDPEDPGGCQFNIRHLRFEFFCDIPNGSEHFLFGTGGEILAALKRLIGNLKFLERLEVTDLLLESKDAIHLLDEAVAMLCDKLKYLTLMNVTKDHFTILHPGCFINLRVLRISPQNVGDEMIEMFANSQSLEELHLVQNTYTGYAQPVSPNIWFRVNHLFRVLLRTKANEDVAIVWQERANVTSVIYDCPFTKFAISSVATVIDLYSISLREFGHLGLPKFRSSRRFANRIDSPLLSLCRRCPYLTTLFVRDRISTSTALLIASMTPNLKYFYVRRMGLLKKIDYKFHFDLFLDFNFSQWIRLNARSYEKTAQEISRIMGNSWKPLSDKEFKAVCSHWVAY